MASRHGCWWLLALHPAAAERVVLVGRAVPAPVARQPPGGARPSAFLLDDPQFQELRHSAADRSGCGSKPLAHLDRPELPELGEVQILGQQVQDAECHALRDLLGSLCHGFGEDDHELPPVAAAWVAFLDDGVPLAVQGGERGYGLFSKPRHSAYTTRFSTPM
jgi:hypothetical protein